MPDSQGFVLAARVRMIKRSLEAVRDSLAEIERDRQVMRNVVPTILSNTYAQLKEIDAAADTIRNLVALTQFDESVSTQARGSVIGRRPFGTA